MIEPGTRIGGLLIEDLLGRGAMGEVYRAMQVSLKRPVAVKRIAGHLVDNPDMVARFEREAQCIARIQNTNVVAVYEFGQYPDTTGAQHYLLVMELVEGGRSLKSFQHGAMDWRLASSVVLQAALGLAAAAEQGVVHRDIKPDNIMITKKGVAKLTDFGLAKAVDSSSMTMGGTLMGTPAYMPPEACRGEATDHRGDLYSLGATWYHLLSGQVPFRSDNTMAMLRAHLDEPTPNILALFPTVPEPIADLVRRCMAKRPEDRPQSAQQLANELMALVAQGIHLKQAVPEMVDAPHAAAGDPSTIATMVAGGAAATAVTKVVSPSPANRPASSASPAAPGPASRPDAATINVPGAQAGERQQRISSMVFIIPIVVVLALVGLVIWGISAMHDHPSGATPSSTTTATVTPPAVPALPSSPTSAQAPSPVAQTPAHPPAEPPAPVVAVAPQPPVPAAPLPSAPPPVVVPPSAPTVPTASPAASIAQSPVPPPVPPPAAPIAHTDPVAPPPAPSQPLPPAQPALPPIPQAVASLPPLPPPPILKQPDVVKPTREAAIADTAITEFRAALRNKRALRAEAYLSSIPSDTGGFKDMVKNLTVLKAAQDGAFASMSRAAFGGHAAELVDAATQAAVYPELAQPVAQSRLYVATIEERWKAALARADEAISHHDTASASALLSEVPADPAVLTAPFTAKRAATAAQLAGQGH